jgi:glucosyl-dolichyl phosphate glucuronosyltransferase
MTTPGQPPPTPKVTVAILTYNRADFLRQTLAGIQQQQFPRDHYEVLVVDNNSADNTREVVQSFAEDRPAPRHVFEPKQGLDHARNRAIREARGEIIVFADDDILVKPDWLSQLVVPLMADHSRRVGALGGEVIPVFPDGLPPWVAEWHAPLAFRTETGPLEAHHSPMGANLAVPRWVFEELGPFSTALDRNGKNLFGGGDAELIRRVRAAGLEVWFSPGAAVKHQMPASRTTFQYAARHAFDSARSRVVDQAGRGDAGGYLLSRLLANALKAPGFALLAVGNALLFRTGDAKKALVRAWRSCGYLYQIPRSLAGKI